MREKKRKEREVVREKKMKESQAEREVMREKK